MISTFEPSWHIVYLYNLADRNLLCQQNLLQFVVFFRQFGPVKNLQRQLLSCITNLQDNQIQELPVDLFNQLRFLRYLDLRNNRLSSLPPLYGHQRFLIIFWLTFNSHYRVETLLLTGNRLNSLPPSLASLSSLKSIHLSDNHLPQVICQH